MDLLTIDKENSILILSILDRIKILDSKQHYLFNFKGFYRGKKISSIEVVSETSEMLIRGEAYLGLIVDAEVYDGILRGRLLKYELVFQ